ncbi:hypothetical protein [Marinobacter zhejiangensis]|uniref:Uncharacterized protein n=1 Tax=Marinobacter zhejiangensis TaxID=488535 RepID=A0A1I4P4F8_9GAMM|nr:hypothetical protein [Marinobacter zhejiangensis]SFM22734.1 hypothetical protein SAMN04487963_1806 [Marinobacter zhejiangensis]
MNNHIRFAAGLVVGFGLCSANALAGNNPSPMGKPFIELQGQIIEVQSDIASLERQFETLRDDVTGLNLDLQGQIDALNAEIGQLQQKDLELQSNLERMVLELEAQGTAIGTLLAQLSQVNQDIVYLMNATGDNAQDIATLESEKTQILGDIAALDAGLVSAISEISDNKSLITMIENEIDELDATKQNDITGQCPEGTSVQSVNNDGSLVCGTTDGAGNQIIMVISDVISLRNTTDSYTQCVEEFLGICIDYETFTIYHYDYASPSLTCPVGFKAIAGGYQWWNATNGRQTVKVFSSYPVPNGWQFMLKNEHQGNQNSYMKVHVSCLAL